MASEVAKALRDRRLTAWNEAKAALENTENRSQADVDRIYDAAMTEVDALDERLKSVLDAEQRSREADAAYDAVSRREVQTPQGNAREAELRSFFQTEAGEQGYKRAIEIQRATRGNLNLRSLGSAANATVTSGSDTVPTDFYDQLISYLVEVSGILQTGPSVLRTQGGETIQIPTVTNHVSAAAAPYAQAQAITVSDPQFAQASLGAAKFATMVQVSRELIDDTAVDLLGYLAMAAGRAIGNSFGSALVNGGTGITGGLVPSITNFVTGASATGNGVVLGGPSYDNLIDLEYSVIAPYRQSRNAYWLAKDQTIGSLRKLTDGNGRPIWEPSPQVGAPDMLLGKPLVADPFMPAVGSSSANKSIVFGDFSQYFVRLVGGLRFERSDDFAFDTDLVTFRAVLRGDGNLVDTHALSALKGGAS
jgi:HK97 family phage major capsid protein